MNQPTNHLSVTNQIKVKVSVTKICNNLSKSMQYKNPVGCSKHFTKFKTNSQVLTKSKWLTPGFLHHLLHPHHLNQSSHLVVEFPQVQAKQENVNYFSLIGSIILLIKGGPS